MGCIEYTINFRIGGQQCSATRKAGGAIEVDLRPGHAMLHHAGQAYDAQVLPAKMTLYELNDLIDVLVKIRDAGDLVGVDDD